MKKETLMEYAYNCILQKIIVERLEPGAPLRESRLAKEFDLSPTPVREAFRRLENEGWLQSLPFKGCTIRKYTFSELEELFILRENMEAAAVGCAILRATKNDYVRIGAIVERERAFIEKSRRRHPASLVGQSSSTDIDFHEAIMNAAHAPLIKRRSSLICAQTSYMIMLNSRMPTTPGDLESVWEEHFMIFQAMRRGWGEAAGRLIRSHVAGGWKKFLRSCGRTHEKVPASSAKTQRPEPENPGA